MKLKSVPLRKWGNKAVGTGREKTQEIFSSSSCGRVSFGKKPLE
jgi:hypothetical protein